MSEPERIAEEKTTELIPKVETGDGTPETREFSGRTPPVAVAPEPAEPAAARKPFIPPELLARRQPAPHSAALSLPFQQLAAQYPAPTDSAQQGTGQLGSGQPGTAQTGSVLTASPSGPVLAEPDGSTAPPAVGDSGTGSARQPSIRNRYLIASGALVLVVVAAVIAVTLLRGGTPANTPTKKAAQVAAAPVTLKAGVSTFDPKGTGFRQDSDGYRTQTYATAKFGNLKEGLGLVLDVGSARSVSTISFQAGNGPLTVELYTADQKASQLSGYRQVGSSTLADGPTKLVAGTGGRHRYWLVWVTRLGSNGGGYAAQISNLVVRGQA